jgi:photosystem II stability/assembly factor-like uncharacterized protein
MMKRHKSLVVWVGAAALTVLAENLVAQDAAAVDSAAVPAEVAADPAADAAAAPVEGGEAATETASAEPVAEEPAPAEEPAAEEAAAEAPAAPVKPRESEILPLAAGGLMLDVVNSGKHLIAVGDRGTILVSNNGKDWAQVTSPVRSALTAISFADENTGWAVGHDAVIVKTADGGKTWALQNFQPELEKAFMDVIALDANNVIAIGAYGLMLQSADGGTTWATPEAVAIRGDELHLNGIAKLANGTLIVVGEAGTIGISSDNGANWEKVTSPYEGSLYGALPLGESGAMIYGLRGNVFKADSLVAAAAPAATPVEGEVPADGSVPADAATPTDAADAAAPAEGEAPAESATDTAAADAGLAEAASAATPFTAISMNTVASFFGAAPLADGAAAFVGLSGAVIKLDASGGTRQLKVKIKEIDGYGKEQEKEITGSFSAAVPFAGGLVLAGEQGLQSIKLN